MKLSAQITILSRVSHLDRLLFTKHLATMIKAGIPIAEALASLVDQTKSPAFKKVLSVVLADIQNGQALAKSLGKHPKAFDQFYLSLIQIGEEAGTLEQNLEFLAKQLSKDYTLRKKIQGAMLYPGLVFGTTAIMGGFISLFVLPKLVDFFEAFEIELPLATKILLFAANTMKDYGILIFAGLALLWFLGYLLVHSRKIKPWWHRLILRFPLFGPLLAYGQLAHFSRNLGTLLKSGVPVTRSLEVTAQTLNNLAFQNGLLFVQQEVQKGKAMGDTLTSGKKQLVVFPVLVAKMIGVGEKTGKLEETLLYLADFYEDDIDNITKNLTTILEPVLLVVIGLVVGFVALRLSRQSTN